MSKTANVNFRLEPSKKRKLEKKAAADNRKPSQVLEILVTDYIEKDEPAKPAMSK